MARLKKLDFLDEKIAHMAERFETLNARCQDVIKKNRELENQLLELKNHNAELREQVKALKLENKKTAELPLNRRDIINKIDRMLEKFGELQI